MKLRFKRTRREGGQASTEYFLVISVVMIGLVASAYTFVPSFRLGVMSLAQDVETALIVGHNPGLELLVEGLTGASAGLSSATLAHLELELDDWRDLRADGLARQVKILPPEL